MQFSHIFKPGQSAIQRAKTPEVPPKPVSVSNMAASTEKRRSVSYGQASIPTVPPKPEIPLKPSLEIPAFKQAPQAPPRKVTEPPLKQPQKQAEVPQKQTEVHVPQKFPQKVVEPPKKFPGIFEENRPNLLFMKIMLQESVLSLL